MVQGTSHAERRRIRDEALALIDETQTAYHRLSDAIWSRAELPMQETLSSALLADHLERAGFEVERGVAGMPTAFVATAVFGSGRPALGILAEYDALPSLSQAAGRLDQAPLVDGAPGHGCTHNTMGTTSTFAAVALKHVLETERLDGTIKLFGCPGEEALISRPYMVRDGISTGWMQSSTITGATSSARSPACRPAGCSRRSSPSTDGRPMRQATHGTESARFTLWS